MPGLKLSHVNKGGPGIEVDNSMLNETVSSQSWSFFFSKRIRFYGNVLIYRGPTELAALDMGGIYPTGSGSLMMNITSRH